MFIPINSILNNIKVPFYSEYEQAVYPADNQTHSKKSHFPLRGKLQWEGTALNELPDQSKKISNFLIYSRTPHNGTTQQDEAEDAISPWKSLNNLNLKSQFKQSELQNRLAGRCTVS